MQLYGLCHTTTTRSVMQKQAFARRSLVVTVKMLHVSLIFASKKPRYAARNRKAISGPLRFLENNTHIRERYYIGKKTSVNPRLCGLLPFIPCSVYTLFPKAIPTVIPMCLQHKKRHMALFVLEQYFTRDLSSATDALRSERPYLFRQVQRLVRSQALLRKQILRRAFEQALAQSVAV